MSSVRRASIVIAALLICLGAFISVRAQATRPMADVPEWRRIFRGIDTVSFNTRNPRLTHIIAARIDLQEPGIRFLVTPPKGDKPHEVAGLMTTTFLDKYKCQLVVNAAAFSGKASHEGDTQEVYTLAISQGKAYSALTKGVQVALLITKDNHAKIVRPPIDTTDAFNAVGGMGDLLRNGVNVGNPDDQLQPRTVTGVSRDGRYLFLVVIDGRQPGYSEGLTQAEAATWLRQLGAWEGMNLDGGGTTSMAVVDAKGKAKLLNSPIDLFIPGKQRIAGSHLGVYAVPLVPTSQH